MSANSPVSIIIPTLNEEKYLPLLLTSLRPISSTLEIIVVDGNSTDQTLEVAEVERQHLSDNHTLKIISLPTRGIAMQRNTGANVATHNILIFCDADVIAPSNPEFQYLISECVKHQYAIASGKMSPSDGGLKERLFHHVAYGVQKLLILSDRPFFGGAFQITRKDVFHLVDGYDETLYASEDCDYAFRVAQHGPYKLFNTPIKTSARRYLKYGYGWIFQHPLTLTKVLFTGRLKKGVTVPYPFGEY